MNKCDPTSNSGCAPATIPALVDRAASQFDADIFLADSDQKICFSDFARLTRKVANALLNSGLCSGDRVAIWAPNIIEWPIAAIGAQCAGAVLVPLNTRFKGPEAAHILQESRAKVLFCTGAFLGTNYPTMLSGESLPNLDKIIVFDNENTEHTQWQPWLDSNQHDSPQVPELKANSLSDILFTSGTTGLPKGVVTTHEQNLRVFSAWSDIVGIGPGDRYLAVNPFFHSFGYKAGILACLIRGTTLLPHAVFDSSDVLKRIGKDKITMLPGPPTLFQSLLSDKDLDHQDISSLRYTATGAASIPVELIQQMKSRLGFERIITAYGLTESCGVVTLCRPGDSAETIANTSGRAMPDTEVRCVDLDNNRVATGENGEIVLRGYNVMQGYFENEEATSEAIDEQGWLHTGDIGNLDENGNLRITDRLKDIYITGGFNCYPAEIENQLLTHPDVAMCAVIGVPDERMGEVGMAFIVTGEDGALNPGKILAWCKDHMADYKAPRHIKIVSSLPLNASGKVVKPQLRERAKTR